MTTVPTTADLSVSADGTMTVAPFIRLDGHADVCCLAYPDRAPVLLIASGKVRLSLSVPDVDQVSEDDISQARRLAEAVTAYLAELERRATAGPGTPQEVRA